MLVNDFVFFFKFECLLIDEWDESFFGEGLIFFWSFCVKFFLDLVKLLLFVEIFFLFGVCILEGDL